MTICVRKAITSDAPGIAKVHVDTFRTTYHGIYPDEFLSNMSYDRALHIWETTHLIPSSQNAVYVAEDEPRHIVGFAICGPDRDNDLLYKGEVIGLYVLQKMQRRGIGKQLMLAAVQDLKCRSFGSMLVWVLADNPSRRFYEKFGGEHVQTRDIIVGGKSFKKFGYAWKSLDLIPQNASQPTKFDSYKNLKEPTPT
ncbi:MAG: GNAT family N-acetyltransferase [Candidatus Bathyarchaeia archaeon]|jgi:GNAT superfamily N-acetyltransferase